MDTNPIKYYRNRLGYSINELSSLTHIHRQTIIRTEQGCYNAIPPRLLDFFVKVLDDPGDIGLSLTRDYTTWVAEKRKRSFGIMDRSYTWDHPTRHPFILWREASSLNRIEVCKLYCVHPSTLTRFETDLSMKSVPTQLYEALSDSGYDTELLDRLSIAYKEWRLNQVRGNMGKSTVAPVGA